MPDLRLAEEPEKAPPVVRQPREIRFRPGADISTIAREVATFQYTSIVADMGAGKSTDLPRGMAEAIGMPVVHAMPNRQLARDQYKYLSTMYPGVYTLWLDPIENIPKSGVVLTNYACITARLLIRRGDPAPLGKVALVADEIHESDLGTYIVDTLGPSIGGLHGFAKASATMGLQRTNMVEPKGDLVVETYVPVAPENWDPGVSGFPWSVTSFRGNALLFVEGDRVAQNLVARYNALGATAYRLSAKMPDAAFDEAMERMRDPTAGVVVLVADYSYRSGFTMDVTTIVDSGLVQYIDVKDGEPEFVTRVAYQGEMDQAARRGARTVGSKCRVYQPNLVYDHATCRLEGVELAAAAVVFRYLGYRPPAAIHAMTAMSAGNVPKDLVAALNSVTPLLLQPGDTMHPLVIPEQEKRESEVKNDVVDVLASYSNSDDHVDAEDFFAAVADLDESQPNVYAEGSIGVLESLQALQANTIRLEFGNYYALHGLELKDQVLPLYGGNWQMAADEIDAKPYIVRGFTREDKEAMLSVLLLRYNHCVLVVRAIEQVTAASGSLKTLAAKHPTIVGSWAAQLSASLRESRSNGKLLLNAVEKLRESDMAFTAIPPDPDVEKRYATSKAATLHDAIKHAVVRVDASSVFSAIEGVGQPTGVGIVELPAATGRGGQRDQVNVRMSPAKGGGYVLFVDAARAVVWNFDNFADTVYGVISKSGMSVRQVKKLVLKNRDDLDSVEVLAAAAARERTQGLPKVKYRERKRVAFE